MGAPPAQRRARSREMPAARRGGPGFPALPPGAADPRARRRNGPGRKGWARRSSGAPAGRGPHLPPGPAPSGASMRPAASPGQGTPAAAAATRPRLPAQRIGPQPGGRGGGGEEPAGRGAQLLRGPGLPILPAAPQHRCGAAPARARPLPSRALPTPAPRQRTPDLAAASYSCARTHPAAAPASVHSLTAPAQIFTGRQLAVRASPPERGKGGANTRRP